MRILLFCFILLFSGSAFAEEPMPQDGERVQIITDQQAGAVRIVIDGQQVAIIDATGLHVRDNINFGGSTKDYSREGFDAHAKGEPRAQ